VSEYRLYKVLDPVTLVEGVARVVIVTGDREVRAVYQIMEFRGFEKLAIGRKMEELPRIMSAICGVCSWSHHLVSGKAVDMVFGRRPTPRSTLIRKLVNYIQVLDSHLLHFALIGLPDVTLWGETQRDISKLLAKNPGLVEAALKTRSLLKVLENKLIGKIQHGGFVVPGGVTRGFNRDEMAEAEKILGEVSELTIKLHEFFKDRVVYSGLLRKLAERGEFDLKAYNLGLVSGGDLELYDGALRLIDSRGRIVAEIADNSKYSDLIGEATVPWNYATLPYYKQAGFKLFSEESTILVGPLARINVSSRVRGEKASLEYGELLEYAGGKPISNLLYAHWARLVEIIHCIEMMKEIMDKPELYEGELVNTTGSPVERGVGVVEAPRGILIHDYTGNEELIATSARVITPTTINNMAINTNLTKVSGRLVEEIRSKGEPSRETIAIMESMIRAYDPCNSCATHVLRINGHSQPVSFTLMVVSEKGEVLWRG
jgi:coenzyme F420-reducing hydrogenase alpha subunit